MVVISICWLQCSKDVETAGIQYVQPVAVVPVGGPVPAVQAGHHQYTVPLATQPADQHTITNRDISVASYGSPSHSAPAHGAPSHGAASYSFGAPGSTYNPPSSDHVPSRVYRGPQTSTRKVDGLELYQTQFSSSSAPGSARPTRTGRLDECYCVPVGQCPANQILGNSPQKDYSKLINPRVKDKFISPAGRSSLEQEEEGSGLETTTAEVPETTEVSRKKRQNDEEEPLTKKVTIR